MGLLTVVRLQFPISAVLVVVVFVPLISSSLSFCGRLLLATVLQVGWFV